MSNIYNEQLSSRSSDEQHVRIPEPDDTHFRGNMCKSAVLHRNLNQRPEEVVKASGLYLILSNGRRIIDATGGAAVSCIGHGDKRVGDVIANQVGQLDYCHSLFFSCPSSEALAKLLIESTGRQMAKAFIVNSGWYSLPTL